MMMRMFLDCRKTYNIALRYVRRMGFHTEEYLLKYFNKGDMKSSLQKMFVSSEGISGHPTWSLLLRTPKVPRQQAVYSLVAHLAAQKTKMEKQAYLHMEFPDAQRFKNKIKFSPKFKSRRGWNNDSISIEKKSFKLLDGQRSFSLFRTLDIRNSANVPRARFGGKKMNDPLTFRVVRTKQLLPSDAFARDIRICCRHGTFSLMVSMSETLEARVAKRGKGREEERTAKQERRKKSEEDRDEKERKRTQRKREIQERREQQGGRTKKKKKKAMETHIQQIIERKRGTKAEGNKGVDIPLHSPSTEYAVRCIDREQMCALDPGVRKFLTGYSPQGSSFVIGTDTTKVLNKCIRRIDLAKKKYVSALQRAKGKQNLKHKKTQEERASRKVVRQRRGPYERSALLLRGYRKSYHRAETKARNVVRDLHYKAAHFLCQSFDSVLLPSFSSHAVVQGHLNKMVKRRLNMLSFYQFKQRLIETSVFYPGVVIKSGSEAYTSKQCGQCGVLNDGLGASEVFKCPKCGLKADRDLHAARNILLRHLE